MKIYAFVDCQNLYMGVRSMGWELDWRKLRQYLKDKYHVVNAFLFIGYKPGNESLYAHLQRCGYILIFKPTMELPDGTIKGNVDAELVLHTIIEFDNYDKAIIISNDGDFFCLVEYLEKHNKLLHLITPNDNYSKLYKPFAPYIVRMSWFKDHLQKKTGIGGRNNP